MPLSCLVCMMRPITESDSDFSDSDSEDELVRFLTAGAVLLLN